MVLDPSGDFAPEPRLQAWLLGRRADGGADRYRLAEGDTLWSAVIPFGWRVVDNRVRVVDRATGELFPWITEVEPQLRREVALRQAAQEDARAAQETARQAEERERLAIEHARLADEREQQARNAAQQSTARERLAIERERTALERAEREAAARRVLEEELARLRRQN